MRAGRLPFLSHGADHLQRRYVELHRKNELAGDPAPEQLRGNAPGARQRGFAAGNLDGFAERPKVGRIDAGTPCDFGGHSGAWRAQSGWSVRPAAYMNSEKRDVLRRHRRKDARDLRRVEAVGTGEEPAEELAVFVEHRIVAVLEQGALRDAHLLAHDALPLHRAAQDPVHAAMAVIGAAVAVLAKGAAEFAQHHHDGVAPGAAHALRERAQAAAELLEARRELSVRAALADVRVPAADVDEA